MSHTSDFTADKYLSMIFKSTIPFQTCKELATPGFIKKLTSLQSVIWKQLSTLSNRYFFER